MFLVADRTPPSLTVRLVDRVSDAVGDLGGATALVPLWVWWALWRGGADDSVWLAAVPLLVLASGVLGRFRRPTLPVGWLCASLVAGLGLVGWSGVSIAWAEDRGGALSATLQLALYVGTVAIVVLWPPTVRGLQLLIIALVTAGLVAAAVVLSGSGGGGPLLIDGQLAGPTGYPNATAALFAMTGLAALGLGVHAPARRASAAWVGLAAGLLAIGLLAQSRGAEAALCLSFCLAVGMTRARSTLVCAGLAIAVAVGSVWVGLASVRTDALRAVHPRLGTPWAVLAAVLIGALLAGILAQAPRRQIRLPGRELRFALRLASGLAIVGLVLAGPGLEHAVAARLDAPDYARLDASSSRFTGDIGSYRPDYWRVALETGVDHPLLGVGAGGFGAAYLSDRRTTKAPQHAHSAPLEALAELGVPGLVLMLVSVGALAGGVSTALRRTRGADHAIRLAAGLPLIFLALHSSVDWVSFFPVLAVPALVLAAAAGVADAPDPRIRIPRLPLIAVGGAIVVVAAIALVSLGAVRLTDNARATWATRPTAALDELRLAGRLDPLDAQPPLWLGIVAVEEHRLGVAAGGLRQASERDPGDWFANYVAGLVASANGAPDAAGRLLAMADRRDPREPLIGAALAAERGGRAVSPLSGVRQALAEQG
jgi:O-Antigen ligase